MVESSIILIALLTFDSRKTGSHVDIKSEGECEKSSPEEVRTWARMVVNTGD
jgi:hypothetical protein